MRFLHGNWQAGLLAAAMTATALAQDDAPVARAEAVTPPEEDAPASLLIGADAALKPALLELAQIWANAHPQIKLDLELTNASTLERVIGESRPYDVALLPGVPLADRLAEKGLLVPGKRRLVARDVLAIMGKSPGEEVAVTDWSGLVGGPWKRISMGDPKLTSSGPHAEAAVKGLGLSGERAPKTEVAPMEEQAIALMRNAKADAVLAWRSQLGAKRRSGEVLVVVGDEKSFAQFYVAASTQRAEHPKQAQAFMDFLVSEAARPVWEKWSLGGN